MPKDSHSPLTEHSSAAFALRAMLEDGLDHISKCSVRVTLDDAEPLHEMRASVRRLRTAFVLFAPCIETINRPSFHRSPCPIGAWEQKPHNPLGLETNSDAGSGCRGVKGRARLSSATQG